jgi:hypothetical protein
MKYFRDLIERLGEALRIKTAPLQARQASALAAPYGPARTHGAQQDRR